MQRLRPWAYSDGGNEDMFHWSRHDFYGETIWGAGEWGFSRTRQGDYLSEPSHSWDDR